MPEPSLLFEKSGQIAKIIFNRPKDYNAFNTDMAEKLDSAITDLESNKEIRVLIFTGAGEKAFISGTDIKELKERTVLDNVDIVKYRQNIFNRIEKIGIPSIAVINGYAFGGGCEIAMACTFRFAAREAMLGQLEINLGLMPGGGGTQRLARLVGKTIAAELLLTGKSINLGFDFCSFTKSREQAPARASRH